jgi:hypothetical protein
MSRFTRRFVPLALVVVAVFALGLTAAPACDELEAGDSCDAGCALCGCCSHAPKPVLAAAGARAQDDGAVAERPDGFARPQGPPPREILHVPRALSS